MEVSTYRLDSGRDALAFTDLAGVKHARRFPARGQALDEMKWLGPGWELSAEAPYLILRVPRAPTTWHSIRDEVGHWTLVGPDSGRGAPRYSYPRRVDAVRELLRRLSAVELRELAGEIAPGDEVGNGKGDVFIEAVACTNLVRVGDDGRVIGNPRTVSEWIDYLPLNDVEDRDALELVAAGVVNRHAVTIEEAAADPALGEKRTVTVVLRLPYAT